LYQAVVKIQLWPIREHLLLPQAQQDIKEVQKSGATLESLDKKLVGIRLAL
jgi:hypothetical protein